MTEENNAGIDLQRWPTERVSIQDLTPADYNPRAISEKALKGLRASLERFGLVQAIVWNRSTGNVVGGHQRLRVLAAAGVQEVECVVVELDAAEEKALNLELNNPHIMGTFTEDLDKLLKDLNEEIEAQAFADLGLDKLLSQAVNAARAARSEAQLPEIPISPELHERQDYLVVVFDNEFDWQVTCDKLGISTVTAPPNGGSSLKRKGTGRVITAARLLKELK